MNSGEDRKTRVTSSAMRKIRKFAPLAIIVVVLLGLWWAGAFEQVSLSHVIMQREMLAARVADNRIVAVAAYMLLYVALVAVSFPGASLLTIAAGFFFGGLIGGAATVFSATAGASAIFLIARSSFGDFLARKAGKFVSRLVDGFNRDAFFYLLSLRLTPIFPFWVINIVPALLNMRLVPYALATFLGIIPGTFAYAFIGAGLDSIIAAQEMANPGCAASGVCMIDAKSLVTPQILIAMAALAVISILPVIVKRLKARKTGQ